ncbi:MAG: type II secretion system F family protein [Bacillota bacterium]
MEVRVVRGAGAKSAGKREGRWQRMSGAALFTFASVLFFVLSLRRKQPPAVEKVIRGEPEKDVVAEAGLGAGTRAEKVPWLSRLEEEAAKAGLSVTARTLLLVAVLGSAAGFTALLAVTGSVWFAAAGLVAGAVLPRYYVRALKKRRAEAFAARFDAALSVLSSSLRAGASLGQALERAAADAPAPVTEEFARVVQAMRFGLPPEDAVLELKKRIECPEVDVFIVATQVLSRTGGNIAEVYDLIGQMVSERRALKRALLAHTSQARLSAAVVSAAPIVVTLFLYAQNPAYFRPMTQTATGRAMLAGCYVTIALGWWVMRRMVQALAD